MSKFWRFIRNIIFVIVIYAVLYGYAMFQGSFMSWFLFFSFLPILLYLLLFIFYPMKKWDVSRNISHQVVYSGSKTKVKIMIRRKLPFPIFYCVRSEEHTSELQSRGHLVCRLLLEKN